MIRAFLTGLFPTIIPSLLLNIRLVLITFSIGALLGGAGALYAKNVWDRAGQTSEALSALRTALSANESIRENYVELRADDARSSRSLAKTEEKIRVVEKIVAKEVVKYVQVNPECNLSVGAVGVLNAARQAGSPDRDVRTPAGTSDEEGRALTDFTLQNEVEAHGDCAVRYASLMARHNELLDYLQLRHSKRAAKQ